MNGATLYLLRRFDTRTKAADTMGIHKGNLSNVLNGKLKPTASQRKKLATVFSPRLMRKYFGESEA
jgi:plasmid maintenance system antidote protein VapI